MKIRIKIKGKWQKGFIDNSDKEKCDLCGEQLWLAPDGSAYCNNDHLLFINN